MARQGSEYDRSPRPRFRSRSLRVVSGVGLCAGLLVSGAASAQATPPTAATPGVAGAAQAVTAASGSASHIAGTFVPYWQNREPYPTGCSGPVTAGYEHTGAVYCGKPLKHIVTRVYFLAGSSVSYSFTVPADQDAVVTYGLPKMGFLNQGNATVRVDGGPRTVITKDEGPVTSTTSTKLALWKSRPLLPGTHTVTMGSEGYGVNLYGLWVASATASGAPGAPTDVTAASATDEQATVNWTAPTNTGGVRLHGYVVTASSPNLEGETSFILTRPHTSITLNDLQDGVSYTFKVAAVNAADLQGPTSVTSNPVTP
jgi:Fibronectin type III domain